MPAGTSAVNAALASAGISAEVTAEGIGTLVRTSPEAIVDVLAALRDSDAAFAFMVDLFGTDTGEAVELTYHLRSFVRDEEVRVRVAAPYDSAVPSVWRVFPAALYPEREAAELLGLTFPGHPNPKRLLTTDEVEVPLLRRSVPIRSAEEVHDR